MDDNDERLESPVSPVAGDSGPDVGGSPLLHHQTVLVALPVHVGDVLCRHQLRHLQSHAQAAVLQDAEVRGAALHTAVLSDAGQQLYTLSTSLSRRRREMEAKGNSSLKEMSN